MSKCNSNWPILCRMVWSRGYQLVANTFYLPFVWFISEHSFFWSTLGVSIARTGHDWNVTIQCSVIWKSKKEWKHVVSHDQIGTLFGSVPIESDYNWSRSTVIYILKIVVWLRETMEYATLWDSSRHQECTCLWMWIRTWWKAWNVWIWCSDR